MFDIGGYLNKFKNLSESRNFLRQLVSDSIKEICGIDVAPDRINVNSGIARINEKPIVKTEIFLHKAKILNLISKQTKKVSDII